MFEIFIYNKYEPLFSYSFKCRGEKKLFVCLKNKEKDWVTSKQNELSSNK